MTIYKNKDIKITTLEQIDKEKVLELFSQNDFNCNYLDGSLKPSNGKFMSIMNNIIYGFDDENNIFVLKKDDEVIGYISMFVEYERLIIGHIAVKKEERKKGYGQLLTKLAIIVAENENRDVSLHCNYPNSYLSKLGFKTKDNIHYFYERKKTNDKCLPIFFVSNEEYKKRKDMQMKNEIDNFSKFLKLNKNKILEIENEELENKFL